uniref:Ov9.5 protein n=1 Tax=Ovine gammaherpesvirus 2 TaxID=10398 RepID=X5JBB4_9GAMA|nr:Ov9.5 protein precursor [Ovine gammaherpesvirus 2]
MGVRRLLVVGSLGLILTLCLQPQQGTSLHRTVKETILSLKFILNLTNCFNVTYNDHSGCSNATLGDKTPGLPCIQCFNISLTNNNSTECNLKGPHLLEVVTGPHRNTRHKSLEKSDLAANVTCKEFGNETTPDILGYWLTVMQRTYHNIHAKKAGKPLQ